MTHKEGRRAVTTSSMFRCWVGIVVDVPDNLLAVALQTARGQQR